MAEENVQQPGEVTIKAEAIKQTINPAGVGNEAVHLPPYHNAETAKIAEDRAKELDGQDKPYEYKANGYTVTEKAGPFEGSNVYEVTAGDFVTGFADKRSAEIYADTHARYFPETQVARGEDQSKPEDPKVEA